MALTKGNFKAEDAEPRPRRPPLGRICRERSDWKNDAPAAILTRDLSFRARKRRLTPADSNPGTSQTADLRVSLQAGVRSSVRSHLSGQRVPARRPDPTHEAISLAHLPPPSASGTRMRASRPGRLGTVPPEHPTKNQTAELPSVPKKAYGRFGAPPTGSEKTIVPRQPGLSRRSFLLSPEGIDSGERYLDDPRPARKSGFGGVLIRQGNDGCAVVGT